MSAEDAKALMRSTAIIVVAFLISPWLGWVVTLLLGADFVYGGNDE